MKPPFTSSGGSTPASSSSSGAPAGAGGAPAAPAAGGGLPGGVPSSLADALPDELKDLVPDELSDLPSCLPGSCDALWNAVDKGMAPVTDAIDTVSKKAAEAKEQAAKTLDEAKAKAAQTIDDAKQAVRENVDMAKKYAELYQNDAKQAWAGLNSVITQQAGCALKDVAKAADALAPGATDAAAGKLGQYVDAAGRYVDRGVQAAQDAGQAAADKARAAEKAATDFAQSGVDKVEDTRKKVFDAVYPVQKFYQDNGLDKLTECGSVPGRPEVPAALTDALQQIDEGTAEGVRAGSDMIEQYAQNSVVEGAIYEAERYRDQGLNELASMTDALKSGIADAIPLSSGCGGPPVPFDGSLLDPGARERYYHKLMNEFETMGKDAKDKMIDDIAKQVMP